MLVLGPPVLVGPHKLAKLPCRVLHGVKLGVQDHGLGRGEQKGAQYLC